MKWLVLLSALLLLFSFCTCQDCSLNDNCASFASANCTFCFGDGSCQNSSSQCTPSVMPGGTCPECSYTNCTECVQDPHCGWCEVTQRCYGGSADLQFYTVQNNSYFDTICSAGWQFAVCSDCWTNINCSFCSEQSECRWCYSTGTCSHADDGSHRSRVEVCHEDQISKIRDALPVYWLLLTGTMVFFMQCGFVMLEAGTSRVKNTKNVLFMNSVDMCICGVAFYILGYGFAFGTKNCPFMGLGYFGLHEVSNYADVFFQFTFAAASSTIISGSVSERISVAGYMILSAVMTAWIYPIIAHWMWSPAGWLYKLNAYDFAGSGVVHLTGAVVGLTSAILLGPRAGRFVKGKPFHFPGHSVALSAAGTLSLWFCWYSFNPGSVVQLYDGRHQAASRAALNSTLSAAVAGLLTFFYFKLRYHEYNLFKVFNATLAGLAAATGPCSVIDASSAFIIGIVTAIVVEFISKGIEQLEIDDCADAFSVHGGGGAAGLLGVGLFAREDYVKLVRSDNSDYGLLYGGGIRLLGVQVLVIVMITVWSAFWATLVCLALKRAKLLRVTKIQEDQGIDKKFHGGFAYNPLEVKVALWVGQKGVH